MANALSSIHILGNIKFQSLVIPDDPFHPESLRRIRENLFFFSHCCLIYLLYQKTVDKLTFFFIILNSYISKVDKFLTLVRRCQ